ncbi:hypothetical protein BDV38DRAFT_236488 [Aspergillus pseudotamarii]|uniref:Uncharacterized protein n=1 Tax=Aspergillus pseudotamarii TaxID=132259 RepID=A0A5N6T678_ASPPS|nr:uncharacterized protein BDV38DRAFT_236488 [Aspergillus pseudotamarii]KAE8141800.1 hypothetical protein BDV38DRAFT_236488 [Aspergillus pseudotamarii]
MPVNYHLCPRVPSYGYATLGPRHVRKPVGRRIHQEWVSEFLHRCSCIIILLSLGCQVRTVDSISFVQQTDSNIVTFPLFSWGGKNKMKTEKRARNCNELYIVIDALSCCCSCTKDDLTHQPSHSANGRHSILLFKGLAIIHVIASFKTIT